MTDETRQVESLLPYDRWTEDAMREVALRALEHAGEHGLPGEHHFYLTFRTDRPGVAIPNHLKVRYPEEMTIVLQHQFWDLKVDRVKGMVSAGLSFGGVPATLMIPISAITAFWDPHVRVGLRFPSAEAGMSQGEAGATGPLAESLQDDGGDSEARPAEPEGPAQVVSLDAFRRRPARD
ncbi:ClpXP protease specificity-enhancing factor SspB [Roseomonas sp. GC11]|uniref:SspB family protein n=1 Tax=Roseomonas sp. GC11 TaxID=2950546 RepID=UPI0021096A42|nr:ClpXP protease specificity-enhancing factor SspB [Roseomonas sp. GC11]MCQ4162969.1 ClpXP protease specificity-enhancing factor SspB [Roseomonas sp. GC11]